VMNIFMLADTPRVAAQMHCDKHVVKMVLESAQMLSTAHRVLDGGEYADSNGLYKATHKNHPSNVWVRANKSNYQWLFSLFYELTKEYTHRYGKIHACSRFNHAFLNSPKSILRGVQTALPQCMPDKYKIEGDSIKAYRDYYRGEKAYFAKWDRGTSEPTWWRNTNG
jgi:hypothetical protein